jgi:hypothetical protein
VVAAVVSASALVVREMIVRRGEHRRLTRQAEHREGELALDGQRVLLEQTQALWSENESLNQREIASRKRCIDLEKQVRLLEEKVRQLKIEMDLLRRRLDRFDRVLPTPPMMLADDGAVAVNIG